MRRLVQQRVAAVSDATFNISQILFFVIAAFGGKDSTVLDENITDGAQDIAEIIAAVLLFIAALTRMIAITPHDQEVVLAEKIHNSEDPSQWSALNNLEGQLANTAFATQAVLTALDAIHSLSGHGIKSPAPDQIMSTAMSMTYLLLGIQVLKSARGAQNKPTTIYLSEKTVAALISAGVEAHRVLYPHLTGTTRIAANMTALAGWTLVGGTQLVGTADLSRVKNALCCCPGSRFRATSTSGAEGTPLIPANNGKSSPTLQTGGGGRDNNP